MHFPDKTRSWFEHELFSFFFIFSICSPRYTSHTIYILPFSNPEDRLVLLNDGNVTQYSRSSLNHSQFLSSIFRCTILNLQISFFLFLLRGIQYRRRSTFHLILLALLYFFCQTNFLLRRSLFWPQNFHSQLTLIAHTITRANYERESSNTEIIWPLNSTMMKHTHTDSSTDIGDRCDFCQ